MPRGRPRKQACSTTAGWRTAERRRGKKDAAERLAVGPKSIGTYRPRIRQELGVDTIAEMARFAIDAQLIATES
jgi:DNA-binding CsgD family transcriptional regulator